MLEDVAEQNRIEFFGAQVVPDVVMLDVPDHDLFGPGLGYPGRLPGPPRPRPPGKPLSTRPWSHGRTAHPNSRTALLKPTIPSVKA